MKATIHHGDCVEVMKTFEDASFSAVVCDPPYALSFMGKEWDGFSSPKAFQQWCRVWAEECLRVLKPGGMLLAFGGSRTFHRLTCGVEDAGFQVRDVVMYLHASGFPKSLAIDKAIDKADGVEREKTLPASDRSRPWQGYGSALKPSFEPIVLAMKPLDGTFAQNAIAHGVAGVNVDGCRIGVDGGTKSVGSSNKPGNALHGSVDGSLNGWVVESIDKGRWPPNLALDEEAAAILDEQSFGKIHSAGAARRGSETASDGDYNATSWKIKRDARRVHRFGDSGGASRFFFTSKTSSAERHMKAPDGTSVDNGHATVKPLDLMQWLVRMVKMPEGTRILDPFAGSFSTVIAALREGVECVGIEREDEYVKIGKQRIVADAPLFNEVEVVEHE